MIILKNYQRSIKINASGLKKVTAIILQFLDYKDFDIAIIFVNKQTMERYNFDFKSVRKPTDILSFASYPTLKINERIVANNDDERCLGDIIMCPVYIQETLEQWDMNFAQRLEHLLIHGICHLLGYDHQTDEDYLIMKALEDTIAKHISITSSATLYN